MENHREDRIWIWIVAIIVMFAISYWNMQALDDNVFIHFKDPVVTSTTEIKIIK